jgi:hypothetical protein
VSDVAPAERDSVFARIKKTWPGLADPATARDEAPLGSPSLGIWNSTRPTGRQDLNALRDRVEVAVRERDRAQEVARRALDAYEGFRDAARVAMADFDAAILEVKQTLPDVLDDDEETPPNGS